MVPSPIRTLSVLTLLTAVSGSVILTHQGSASSTSSTGAVALSGPAEVSAAALPAGGAMIARSTQERASRSQARGPLAAAEVQELRSDRAAGIAEAETERAAEVKRKKAEARRKADAKAARERKAQVAARASRNARSDPQALARVMLASHGWSGQFGCLESLWNKESRWNYQASNPSSGAYGIPQALPGSKMSSAGADWRTNPATQISWGLDYIEDRYGSPCGAWSHSRSTGWY